MSAGNRSVLLSVRLSADERAAIERRARRVGVSISELARRRLLGKAGEVVIEVDGETLRKVYRDLRHAGGNVNQIARQLNRDHSLAPLLQEDIRAALSDISDASREVVELLSLVKKQI